MLNSCILASLLTCLAWAGPGLVAGESPLRLGVLANRGELAARTQWSEFAAWLGQQAGRPGELTPLAIGQVPKAVGDATVDLLICNPGLAARVVQESGAVPIATWKAKDGSTRMAGVIIANPKAGIAGLGDLRGRKVMTYGDDSAGAWQFQAALLQSRGLDPTKDIQRTISKKQDDIVLAVKAGAFDAGFVRNGVVEDLIAKQRIAVGDVVVVEAQPTEPGFAHARTTPFYPEWFLLATRASQALVQPLAAACLALPTDHPALIKAEITGWIAPVDLAPTLELLRLLKQPPFDR